MNKNLKQLLIGAVVLELLILLFSFMLEGEVEGTFKLAARLSGRIAPFVFLPIFYFFVKTHPQSPKQDLRLKRWVTVFAVMHIIHLGFLAANVQLNYIPLVPYKLAGGALAYLMIVVAPFVWHKLKFAHRAIYFYYVTLVMILTYLARAKGEFEGADPSIYHQVAIVVLVLLVVLFTVLLIRKRRQIAG